MKVSRIIKNYLLWTIAKTKIRDKISGFINFVSIFAQMMVRVQLSELWKKPMIMLLPLFVIYTVSFYIMDSYAISNIDDWRYAFVCEPEGEDYLSVFKDGFTREPITSFTDAVKSQEQDYYKTNGRFITHTLTQYFCGTCSMKQFVIINTLVFAIFVLCVIKLTRPKQLNISSLLIILMGIWLLIPFKGITFMGNISLSINYLWAAAFNLLFIILYQHIFNRQCSLWWLVFILPFAIITGSLQESFSIGICGALCFHALIHYKRLRFFEIAILCAYVIGSLTCILSPANFNRADDIGGFGFHLGGIFGLFASPVMWLFLITLIFLAKRKALLSYFLNDSMMLSAAIITILFVLFVAYNGRHQLMSVNIFMFIFVCKTWFSLCKQRRIFQAAAIMLTIIFLLTWYPILHARKTYYDAYQQLVKRCYESQDGYVNGHDFEYLSAKYFRNLFLNYNYVGTFTFLDWGLHDRDLSLWMTKGKNNTLVTAILPNDKSLIVKDCNKENEIQPNLFRISDGPLLYYVLKSSVFVEPERITSNIQAPSKYIILPDEKKEYHPSDVFEFNHHYYYLIINPWRDFKVLSVISESGE